MSENEENLMIISRSFDHSHSHFKSNIRANCPACEAGIPRKEVKIIVVDSGKDITSQLTAAASKLNVPVLELIAAFQRSPAGDKVIVSKMDLEPEKCEREESFIERSPHSFVAVKERNRFFNKRKSK